MSVEEIHTVIVGGGQAGLAMSEHLSDVGVSHVVLERARIAERWRTQRWDSLVANGPAWHDRFPTLEFEGLHPDGFASRDAVVDYFETHARNIDAPIRCNVEVTGVSKQPGESVFHVQTSDGIIKASNLVAATGPFQQPVIPPVIPQDAPVVQLHSSHYRNPSQIADGAVLVIGAGSSGSQIADELLRAGRDVFLSVGPHDRPPRSYRGRDFVWWLGVLGKWETKTIDPSVQHVTIAVSGAYGGHTIDFRQFAARGMTLLGMTDTYANGVLTFRKDLNDNVVRGDTNYLSLLDEADAYVASHNLDLPEEPEARLIPDDPVCLTKPIEEIDLAAVGIKTIIWATGYVQDFSWLNVNAVDNTGKPQHERGVSTQPGIYFLGLPWLSMRGSSFIWGVWLDAKFIAEHIKTHRTQKA